MKDVKAERYEDITEFVENTVWRTVVNDAELNDNLFSAVKTIFVEGNNVDTEKNLEGVLNDDDNETVREMQRNIGEYLIRHIVDKNYMDGMVKIFKDKIIEEIVEDVKQNIEVLCLQDVESMEVISQGQFDDFIKEEDLSHDDVIIKVRTFLSRMTVEDGMKYNNQITEEIWVNGSLESTEQYECIPY